MKGWSLEINRPAERYTSHMPAPDPNWRYTDKAGHDHHRAENSWPTLKWVVDHTYWCESCNDDHEEWHWECALCDESIEPGSIPGPHHFVVAGLTSGWAQAPNGDRYMLRSDEITALQEHGQERLISLLSEREPDEWTRRF